MSRVVMAAAVAVALAGPATSRADMIFIGGYNFQSNAFADTLVSSYASEYGFVFGPLFGGVTPPTLAQAVTGPYVGDYAGSLSAFSYVQLGFTDNVLRNGPGPDLALFETGIVRDRFAVALAPSFSDADYRDYQSAYTGFHFGAEFQTNELNVALVDLSDLGVPLGGELTSITVGLYPVTVFQKGALSSASLTAAAAFYPDPVTVAPGDLTPVPGPSGVVLAFVAGVVGLVARWRRSVGVAAVVVALAVPSAARADMIYIGGYNFAPNAFADTVVSSYSTDPIDGGFYQAPLLGGMAPVTFEQAILGPYTGDAVFSPDLLSYVQLGFTDNVLRNGPGPDLALFETGIVADVFAVALAPSASATGFREYTTAYTGFGFGSGVPANYLNVALVDLSDFGVPAGEVLNSITVGLYPVSRSNLGPGTVSLTAVAAFYPGAGAAPSDPTPVPAPPGLLLALAAGVVGVAVKRRRG